MSGIEAGTQTFSTWITGSWVIYVGIILLAVAVFECFRQRSLFPAAVVGAILGFWAAIPQVSNWIYSTFHG